MDFSVIAKKKRVSAVGTASSKKNPSVPKAIKAKGFAPSSKQVAKKVTKAMEQETMEIDEEEWENAHEISEEFNFDDDEEEAMNERLDDDGWEVFPAKK